jgi:hypothetical protein
LAHTLSFGNAKSLRLLECGAPGIPIVCSEITRDRESPARRFPNDVDASDSEGCALRQWLRESSCLQTIRQVAQPASPSPINWTQGATIDWRDIRGQAVFPRMLKNALKIPGSKP